MKITGFTSKLLPTADQTKQIFEINRSGVLPLDTTSLQTVLSSVPPELARYDAEIERLLCEREILASHLESCRSALAPVHRLPVELLSDIFELCFPAELYRIDEWTSCQMEIDRVSHRHLLNFAHVCARWYRFTTGTPKLWSTITVDTSLWSGPRLPDNALLFLLECALDRGRDYPLNITVYIECNAHHGDAVLTLLSKHAGRWHQINILSNDQPSRSLSSIKGSLNRLQKVELDTKWKKIDIFEHAPCLTEFTFHGKSKYLPNLPWRQIQTLTCVGDPYTTARPLQSSLALLRSAANVEHFTARLDLRDCNRHSISTSPMVSSKVRHLDLQLAADHPGMVEKLFDSLILPSLTSFTISRFETDPCEWPTTSTSFLLLAKRSGFAHHLLHLSLDTMIPVTELLRCLEVLPALENLTIKDCILDDAAHIVITDTLLRGLTYVAGTTPLAPKLHVLKLESILTFTESIFVELIDSRVKRIRDIEGEQPFRIILSPSWMLDADIGEFRPELVPRLEELESKLEGRLVVELE
ncbi:hypothetical protein R3P38DRAFT_2497144 [Favolaschia claudopus]|uniref:F-box domain-containing protein n=1 Tax=Favolaschia claudopus TaxID=2862362 RepID=A0AAW0E3U2_9AGAR